MQVPEHFWILPVADRLLVSAAHRRQVAVHVWTVDEVEVRDRVVARGADGIMTDRPGALVLPLPS
jgi:glycerophosphoryl diester phosphodiesterase